MPHRQGNLELNKMAMGEPEKVLENGKVSEENLKNSGEVVKNGQDKSNGTEDKGSFLPSHDTAIMTNLSDFTLYTNGLRESNFEQTEVNRPKKIYRVVLTGGPCGGKTTGQARLCTFFENMGWKVFRVPETATVLLSGGIKFGELTPDQALQFQEELIRTMMQIERSYFRLAETVNRDVLIICDRGAMDASAYIPRDVWEGILSRNGWNEVDLRDTRYNHIIHMVSAANGAEPFYSTDDHTCRTEGLELAKDVDQKCAMAWVGHPYFDVVDNSTDFESKLNRMIQVILKRIGQKFNEDDTSNRKTATSSISSDLLSSMSSSSSGYFDSSSDSEELDDFVMCICQKLGIDVMDRLQNNAKKAKFLVRGPLPGDEAFPSGYQDFNVVHDYLQSNTPKMQIRLRKRGQKGHFSYSYTVRHPELQGQVVEVRTPLTQRDYLNMLSQKEPNHFTVYKDRRCFLLNDQYFQMDSYKEPCHPRCKGLIFLETYTTLTSSELAKRLPKFLHVVREVTGDPRYSMFNLSLKEQWQNNKHFCQSLAGSDSEESLDDISVTENRLILC